MYVHANIHFDWFCLYGVATNQTYCCLANQMAANFYNGS